MPTPEFITKLRAKIGHDELWLTGCSTVVVRDNDGATEVLLARRADNHQWSTIDGIVEPLEPPQVAAARECLEETELEVEIERLVMTGVHGPIRYPNGDVCSYVDLVFRAHPVRGDIGTGDGENTDVAWFRIDQLPPLRAFITARIDAALSENPQTRLAGRYEQD